MVENNFERNEHFFDNEILDVLDGDFYFNSEDNVSLDEWIQGGPNPEEFSPKFENLNDCSQETSHSRSPLKEFLVFHDEPGRFDVQYLEENSLTTETHFSRRHRFHRNRKMNLIRAISKV